MTDTKTLRELCERANRLSYAAFNEPRAKYRDALEDAAPELLNAYDEREGLKAENASLTETGIKLAIRYTDKQDEVAALRERLRAAEEVIAKMRILMEQIGCLSTEDPYDAAFENAYDAIAQFDASTEGKK